MSSFDLNSNWCIRPETAAIDNYLWHHSVVDQGMLFIEAVKLIFQRLSLHLVDARRDAGSKTYTMKTPAKAPHFAQEL